MERSVYSTPARKQEEVRDRHRTGLHKERFLTPRWLMATWATQKPKGDRCHAEWEKVPSLLCESKVGSKNVKAVVGGKKKKTARK